MDFTQSSRSLKTKRRSRMHWQTKQTVTSEIMERKSMGLRLNLMRHLINSTRQMRALRKRTRCTRRSKEIFLLLHVGLCSWRKSPRRLKSLLPIQLLSLLSPPNKLMMHKEVEGDISALTRRIMLMEEESKKAEITLANTVTKLAVSSKQADDVLKKVKVVESKCMNNEVTLEELDKNLRQ